MENNNITRLAKGRLVRNVYVVRCTVTSKLAPKTKGKRGAVSKLVVLRGGPTTWTRTGTRTRRGMADANR